MLLLQLNLTIVKCLLIVKSVCSSHQNVFTVHTCQLYVVYLHTCMHAKWMDGSDFTNSNRFPFIDWSFDVFPESRFSEKIKIRWSWWRPGTNAIKQISFAGRVMTIFKGLLSSHLCFKCCTSDQICLSISKQSFLRV